MDDSQSKTGFQRAAQDLIDDGYTVESLNISNKDTIPKDATALVIAGARDRFLPNEVQTILAWLNGGRAFFLLEAGVENGLDSIFRPFGVDVGDNLIDPNPASQALGFSRGDAPIVNRFEQHRCKSSARNHRSFYWVRSVAPRIGLARIEASTLIQTSETSWGETKYASGEDVELDEDVPGPVPIAIAVTKKTTTNPNRLRKKRVWWSSGTVALRPIIFALKVRTQTFSTTLVIGSPAMRARSPFDPEGAEPQEFR